MSNYYMYNGNFRDISKLKPLTFNKDGKALNTFKLEDLDSLTTTFNNEKEFIEALKNMPNYKGIVNEKAPIIIVHKALNELRCDEVIYNDKFLYRCAQEVRSRKKRGELEKGIRLYPTKDVLEFISRVKQYLMDSSSFSAIMNEFNDPHLRMIITDYVFALKNGIYTEDEKEFYDSSNRRLELELRKYKILRKFVIFEKKRNKLMSFNNQFDQIQNERDNSSEKYSLDDLIEEDNKFVRDMDSLACWYKEGGISAVLEHIDLDDLLSYSKADLDEIGLGYLKEEENGHDENQRIR